MCDKICLSLNFSPILLFLFIIFFIIFLFFIYILPLFFLLSIDIFFVSLFKNPVLIENKCLLSCPFLYYYITHKNILSIGNFSPSFSEISSLGRSPTMGGNNFSRTWFSQRTRSFYPLFQKLHSFLRPYSIDYGFSYLI